jgi:hypothetical protein
MCRPATQSEIEKLLVHLASKHSGIKKQCLSIAQHDVKAANRYLLFQTGESIFKKAPVVKNEKSN